MISLPESVLVMANVRVAVRVRPLSGREVDTGARNIVTTRGNSLSITNVKVDSVSEYGDSRDRVKHFSFDYCYDSNVDRADSAEYASQELVYQDLGTEVLQAAFDGYNACLFAYGQTGTGKTYTMMGYPGEIGLTPRICEGLFSHVDDCPEESVTFRVEISYLEIYNEKVRDLLRVSQQPQRFTLKVREHPKDGPYVQDLTRQQVKDYHEIQTLLDRGNQLRTTASTHMHEHSSRSHAIVTVNFTQAKLEDGMPSETVSKVHLVDLAGSERADPNYSANYKGRIKEGANINKSLYTLGFVIKALAEKSILAWSTDTMGSDQSFASGSESQSGSRKPRVLYIPYRDSVLTWLLKDSLGGNSKTLMIATITPASQYYSETISTLRYAQQAKRIVNQPRINEDSNVSLIRQLRQEIERLKQMLASARMSPSPQQLNEILYLLPGMDRLLTCAQSDLESEEGGTVASEQDSGALLSEKLKENEAMANQLTQSWLNKWSETQTLMQDTDLSIRGLGRRSSSYGVIIDSQLPHLIGMDDDILSTGVIIFHLKEGTTLIGREDARREQDIVLEGLGIQSEHCHVKNEGGQVVLYPHHGASCSVNGIVIHEPTTLTQGDVLLLGKTNMYRFNNPAQAAKLRQHRQSLQDGELLSSTSSLASLSDTELFRATPLRMFNPNVEVEHAYANEDERIQHARNELERVRAELSVQEEQKQEEEETLWTEHEKHREEVAAEKIRLARLRERLLSMEEEAETSLGQQRQRLQDSEDLYQQQLQQQLGQLSEKKSRRDSTSQQTDPQHLSSSAIQTDPSSAAVAIPIAITTAATATSGDVAASGDLLPPITTASVNVVISGPDGEEIQQRRLSIEGQIKVLAQTELLHSFHHQRAVEELQREEERVEGELEQSRGEVESRLLHIQQMEQHYRHTDATKLSKIQHQKEQLEELHRQEEQLELYLEEKQDLLAVGQAQPQPLRGAHSELFLPAHGATFETQAARATSENNVGERAGSNMSDEEMSESNVTNDEMSESNISDSRESMDQDSEQSSSAGFYLSSNDSFDRLQSLGFPPSESAEVQQDEHSGLSQGLGSDMDTEERHRSAMDSAESLESSGLSASSRSLEGRGRARVRTGGRGRPRTLQSQGQGKPESPEDKKLTTRAEEVTSRLYQPKSIGLQGRALKRKQEKDEGATSYSPPTHKSPSPKPSSKSPKHPVEGKRGDAQSPHEAVQKKSRNRDEWERPWRTRPPTLDRKREEEDQSSPSHRSLNRNRENWDRPWRQGRPPPSGGSKSTALPKSSRSPTASKKGTDSEQSDHSSITQGPKSSNIRISEDMKSRKDKFAQQGNKEGGPSLKEQKTSAKAPVDPSKRKPLLRDGDSSDDKHQSKKIGSKKTTKALPPHHDREESRKKRFSGSDSSLVTGLQRQQPYRPRSRTRQISSASSLPSVPEAAAEGDTDLDSAPLTSESNMAALVAAVPRRQRRGRFSLEEEEERRHSEPVGDKWAQALAQYTAEMESGMGREGLHKLDHVSPTSSLEWVDNTVDNRTTSIDRIIPQINVIEASPCSSDDHSSQDSLQPPCIEQSQDSAVSVVEKEEPTYSTDLKDSSEHSEMLDMDQSDVHFRAHTDLKDVSQVPTHKVGHKRQHKEEAEQQSLTEMIPKKKKANDEKDGHDTVGSDSQAGVTTRVMSVETDSFNQHASPFMPGQKVMDSEQEDQMTGVQDRDSDGSYSPDSLDEDEVESSTMLDVSNSRIANEHKQMEFTSSTDEAHSDSNIGEHAGFFLHEKPEESGEFVLHESNPVQDSETPREVSQPSELAHHPEHASAQIEMGNIDLSHSQRTSGQVGDTVSDPNMTRGEAFTVNLDHPGSREEASLIESSQERGQEAPKTGGQLVMASAQEVPVTRSIQDVFVTGKAQASTDSGQEESPVGSGPELTRTGSEGVSTENGQELSGPKLSESGQALTGTGQDFVVPERRQVVTASGEEMPVKGNPQVLIGSGQEVPGTGHILAGSGLEALKAENGEEVTGNGEEASAIGSSCEVPVVKSGQEVTGTGQETLLTGNGQEVAGSGEEVAGSGQDATRSGREVAGSGQGVTRSGQEVAESGREGPGGRGEAPMTLEMLTVLAEEDEEGSQLSDEGSSSHVEKQIQALQEVLHQLSPRTAATVQPGSSTHSASNRRGKRRQHSRHLKESHSDNAEHESDDALASGPNSRSSSRPSSGSRRRRRPPSKATDPAVKKYHGHSSEEYVSSDSSSIFSDDSLTHSSERHETSASQISDIRTSIQQLTSNLAECEAVSEVTSAQDSPEDTMEDQSLKSVPALVSYFESRATQSQDEREQSPSRGRVLRESSVTSYHSDEGSSSSNEATQTEGSSVVMSKAPVSVLSTGDPNFVISQGTLQALSGNQSVEEVSSIGAQTRRSWKLSITPTEAWQSGALQSGHAAMEEGMGDVSSLRRKSKAECSVDTPEKRQRQDKLNTLHSKYGLGDEGERMTDEEEQQGESTAVSGQSPGHYQTNPPVLDTCLQKTQTATRDSDGKLLFEVTINQDETNVLYNVETKEYKAYSLKNSDESADEGAALTNIPESININLTETTTVQREDHFETVTKERVIFEGGREKDRKAGGDLLTERTFTRGYMIDVEQDREGRTVSRESSVERMLKDEDSNSSLRVSDSMDFTAGPYASSELSMSQPGVDSNVKTQSVISRQTLSTQSRLLSAEEGREVPAAELSASQFSSPPAVSSSGQCLGFHDHQFQNSNLPAGSGITKPSVPGSVGSNDSTDHGFMSGSELPRHAVMRREDINNTFRMNESGSVISQHQQTIVMHQRLPRQDTADTGAPAVQSSPQEGSGEAPRPPHHWQLHVSPHVTSYLLVEQDLPDTPPPVKITAQGSSHTDPSQPLQHGSSQDSSQHVTTALASVKSSDGIKDSQTGPEDRLQGRVMQQAVEIPVVHQRDEGVSVTGSQESAHQSVSVSHQGFSGSERYPDRVVETGQTGRSEAARTDSSVNQERSEQNTAKTLIWKSSGAEVTYGADDSVRIFPPDIWLSGVEEESQQVSSSVAITSTSITDRKEIPQEHKTLVHGNEQGHVFQDSVSSHHKESLSEETSLLKDSAPTTQTLQRSLATFDQKTVEHLPQRDKNQQRQSHPSVEEIPLESVDSLPAVAVEQDSKPAVVYPDSRDGLLLHTSSSCSEEPYSWVDVFREETGIMLEERSWYRSSRLASEQDAEFLLAKIKRRNSHLSDSSSEEELFFEEVVVTTHHYQPTTCISHYENKLHQKNKASSCEDAEVANQNPSDQNFADMPQVSAAQHQTTSHSLASEEFHSVSQLEVRADSQQGHCSTPLPQASLSPGPLPEQSPRSSDPAGRLPLLSDDSTCRSAEDSFHSPDTTLRSDSESSMYKTPQQSSRENEDLAAQGNADSASLAFKSYPGEVSGVRVEKVEGGKVTAVAGVIEGELEGRAADREAETVREILKREVERQIARLERRVRSLSDSAISSDFTEPESNSVSPRSSRVPVCDISMDYLSPEASLHRPTFFPNVFFSNTQVTDDLKSHGYTGGKRTERHQEKSLEDSGNIHDDQWQDSCSGQKEDQERSRKSIYERKPFGGDSFAQSRSTHGLSGATRLQNVSPGSPATLNSLHASTSDKYGSLDPHAQVPTSSQEKRSSQATSKISSLSPARSMHPELPSSSTLRDLHQLTNRFSEQVVGAVDSVLSVQQSGPSTSVQSYSHLRRRGRGLVGRRTRSLSNLEELAAAKQYNSLEENLVEQVRLLLQETNTAASSGTKTTAGKESKHVQGEDAVDNDDTKALSDQMPSQHVSFSVVGFAKRAAVLSGNEEHVLHGKISELVHSSGLSRNVAQQAVGHDPNAGVGRSGGTVIQSAPSERRNVPVQQAQQEGMHDKSATAAGSTEDRAQEDVVHSPDTESDGGESEEYLLTSGELEVAAITARAAVRNSRPQTEPDTSRALSPGEEILADILARQYGVLPPSNTEGGSSKFVDQLRIRGASPLRRPPSRREVDFSQEELSLSEQAAYHLQSVQGDLEVNSSVEDLLQSSPFQSLGSEGWSAGQLKMLHYKALSTSSLDCGHYEGDEDQEDVLMDRPASLACLEGLVLEDCREDGDSSVDSICFVFMGQKTPESEAHLQAMGGSITEFDDSGHLMARTRSTEDVHFHGQQQGLPFSEHSASMDNIYHAVSTSTQTAARLHRSRSASMLDVGTNTSNDMEMNEAVFPPRIHSGSCTSLEGVVLEHRDSFSEKDGDDSTDMLTITNPSFIHRPSLVEPTAEQHIYMSSPTQLYTSRPGYSADSPSAPFSSQAVVEVESGQPYFRHRIPGAQPQLSDNGAQTEKDTYFVQGSSVTWGPEGERDHQVNTQLLAEPLGAESLKSLHQASSDAGQTPGRSGQLEGLHLSPSNERWMELSHLMIETTEILQNLQQTLPSPKSPFDSPSSLPNFRPPVCTSQDTVGSSAMQTGAVEPSAPRMVNMEQRKEMENPVDMGTQTPTLPGEPFSPHILFSRYPSLARPLDTPTIIIKVKDTVTQTGLSLGDLTTVEAQTDSDLPDQAALLRPSTRDASSSVDTFMNLTTAMSQTDDDVPFDAATSRSVRDASSRVYSLGPSDQMGSAPGTTPILKETKDASSSYDDMILTSDTPSQTDDVSDDTQAHEHQTNMSSLLNIHPATNIVHENYSAARSPSQNAAALEKMTDVKSFQSKSSLQQGVASVCTQMTADAYSRCIAVGDADDVDGTRSPVSSLHSAQERGALLERTDRSVVEERLMEKKSVSRERHADQPSTPPHPSEHTAMGATLPPDSGVAIASDHDAERPQSLHTSVDRASVADSVKLSSTSKREQSAVSTDTGGHSTSLGTHTELLADNVRAVSVSTMQYEAEESGQSGFLSHRESGSLSGREASHTQQAVHTKSSAEHRIPEGEKEHLPQSSAVSQHLRTSVEKENQPAVQRPGHGRGDGTSRRKHEGELSYKLEERLEMLPRAQVSREQEEGSVHDSSLYSPDMFSSTAQQRAAWRARLGDFSLSAGPSVVMQSDKTSPQSARADIHREHVEYLRERSPNKFPVPQQNSVLDEIDKLRQEHNRMMQLLERSRDRSTPLLSHILRTRSASPRMTHAGSGSSSSDSMVTVITGRGSVRESPVTVTTGESTPLSSDSTLQNVKDSDMDLGGERDTVYHSGVESTSSAMFGSVGQRTQSLDRDRNILLSGHTERTVVPDSQRIRTSVSTSQEMTSRMASPHNRESRYTEERISRRLSSGPITTDSPSRAPAPSLSGMPSSGRHQKALEQTTLTTSPEQHPATTNASTNWQSMESQSSLQRPTRTGHSLSETVSERSPHWADDNSFHRQQELEVSRPPLDTQRSSFTTDNALSYSTARQQHAETTTVDSPSSEWHRSHQDHASLRLCEASPGLGVPPLGFLGRDESPPDVLLKTSRSAGADSVSPGGHRLLSPTFISTGVEATVDSSDDFTQTDAEEDGFSNLNTSISSAASSGTTETRRIRAELDRLQQEHVEIIELLSLQYLPGSLTVELLEAKLNYCHGQTDMLLASLEKAWENEEPLDTARYHHSRRHEEILSQYREQFEQSRQDLQICMEEARRIHSGTRGRRKARTSDVLAMRRRAQIAAFREEREREQALFDRHRNVSPDLSDASSTSPDPSDPGRRFAPQFMTPRQHKEHMVQLRRSVVAASSEELNELRARSRSNSVSRSPTPDYSASPVSSRSNFYPSRESSSSLSPDRSPMFRPSTSIYSYSSTSQVVPRSYSAPNSRATESGQRVPRLVLPSGDLSSPSPSHSQRWYEEPRSSSCGYSPSSSHLRDSRYLTPPEDFLMPRQNVSSQSARESDTLDPEQLLRESYAARQLNREQISKAQEALRLLEQHRKGFRSHRSSTEKSRHSSLFSRHGESPQRTAGTSFSEQGVRRQTRDSVASRHVSSARSLLHDSGEPPKFTSTPRSTDSYTSYARDVLTRSERRIQDIIARGLTEDASDRESHDTFPSYTSSSLSLSNRDSLRDTSYTSARDSSRFTASRPISSHDIKARIARRMQEKSKTKK